MTRSRDPAASRRELTATVVLCLLGAAAVLAAVSRSWASAVQADAALPPVELAVPGGEVAALAGGIGLVGLAATAALLATRGAARQAVAGVVTLAGGGALVDALLGQGRAADRIEALVPPGTATHTTPWPWVAAAGGLALLVAGALALARSRAWPGMSRRYDSPPPTGHAPAKTGSRSNLASDPEGAWRALDRGEDPTA